MSKKNRNQNKKENKSQQIYLGNGLATILKEVKPLFETRKGYAWPCPLKNLVDDDITAVYVYNDELYAISCDLFDTPFGELSNEIRNQIREEVIKWLKEQPQIQGEYWIQYRWSSQIKDSDVLAWVELSDLNDPKFKCDDIIIDEENNIYRVLKVYDTIKSTYLLRNLYDTSVLEININTVNAKFHLHIP